MSEEIVTVGTPPRKTVFFVTLRVDVTLDSADEEQIRGDIADAMDDSFTHDFKIIEVKETKFEKPYRYELSDTGGEWDIYKKGRFFTSINSRICPEEEVHRLVVAWNNYAKQRWQEGHND